MRSAKAESPSVRDCSDKVTGERLDIERVTGRSERGRWKSTLIRVTRWRPTLPPVRFGAGERLKGSTYRYRKIKMNRILANTIALFVLALLWNGLVHLVLLKDFMPIISEVRRSDFKDVAWLSFPLTLALVFLFSLGLKAFSKSGLYREGLYFGLYFGLVAGVLVNFNQYILYPIPGYIQATWFCFGVAEFCIYSLVSTFILFRFRRSA